MIKLAAAKTPLSRTSCSNGHHDLELSHQMAGSMQPVKPKLRRCLAKDQTNIQATGNETALKHFIFIDSTFVMMSVILNQYKKRSSNMAGKCLARVPLFLHGHPLIPKGFSNMHQQNFGKCFNMLV